jgi:hypothetical protein
MLRSVTVEEEQSHWDLVRFASSTPSGLPFVRDSVKCDSLPAPYKGTSWLSLPTPRCKATTSKSSRNSWCWLLSGRSRAGPLGNGDWGEKRNQRRWRVESSVVSQRAKGVEEEIRRNREIEWRDMRTQEKRLVLGSTVIKKIFIVAIWASRVSINLGSTHFSAEPN